MIESCINHPVVCWSGKAIAETAKIAGAVVILGVVAGRLIKDPAKISRPVFIVQAVILAPLIEEVLFRGVVLKGIGLFQKGWSYMRGAVLDENAKKKFRVHLTALGFAALHLANPHRSLFSASVQFVLSYIG